jgi:hypothetical protein
MIVHHEYALGAAVYFDKELAADPTPFASLIAPIFGTAASRERFTQWTIRLDNKKARAPRAFELNRLLADITNGTARSAAVETPPQAPDADSMLVCARTTPIARLGESDQLIAWRYDLIAGFGATALATLGAARAIDLIAAFAGAVGATAGVLHWAASFSFASSLAMCASGAGLTPEQDRKVAATYYWRSQWGRCIRGPSWGTVLSATHVDRLGGVRRLERESGCASVVPLSSNGALLLLTPIDSPIVEDHDDRGRLEALERFLQPVLGKARV